MAPRIPTWFAHACALMLAGLLLAGCGNKEPEERAAFIQFLQTRVIDRPGVRVPQPTEEQKKPFGAYAQHYTVITDFNTAMNRTAQQMDGIVAKGSLRSLSDVVARRDDLRSVREGVQQMRRALDENLAKANAARAQLQQPEDLKAVFDKAYDKTVTTPAGIFRDVFPALDAVFDGAIRIGDYVDAHKSQIQVSGSTFTVSDPKVLNELNGMLQQLNSHSAAIQTAQRRMRTAVAGG
ncbi:DUF3053 domain-containing protein [Xenophilus sp.]|uniref:DUF3053 domain-containing protein n=1 Tax=Xenophilus sp. TaxID=1873499 RepID=UPI0037DC8902